jgi:hypothetical protein
MPLLASAILGGLLSLMGSLVGRAILALGFGFVEYAGISTLVSYVVSEVNASMTNFAGVSGMMAWAGFMRIDIHISILLSAIGVKVLMNSLGGATVRRLIQK